MFQYESVVFVEREKRMGFQGGEVVIISRWWFDPTPSSDCIFIYMFSVKRKSVVRKRGTDREASATIPSDEYCYLII